MALTQVPIELSSTPGIVDNSNATAITIDSSENVGIDVVPESWLSSYSALQIGASGALSAITSGNENVGLSSNTYLATDGNFKYIATNEATRYLQSAGVHYWYTAASGTADTNVSFSQNMTLDSSGNLLVGTTSSQSGIAKAAVEFDSGSQYGLEIKDGGAGSTGTFAVFYRGSTGVGTITTNGTTTAYNTSSDYRLKENVVPLTGATERVKQLNPSRFNFIADPDSTVDGFLAHEVADVVPEAITGTHNEVDDDGNPVYQGIDQSKLVPLLVATIQELEARITQLENN